MADPIDAGTIDCMAAASVARNLRTAANRLQRAHEAALRKSRAAGPHRQHYRDMALVHRLARNEILAMLERFQGGTDG